jgi:hypothetical protein
MRWNACGIDSRPAGRASYGKRKQMVTMVVVSTCAAALPVQPESDRLLGVINFGAFSIYREKPRN